MRRHPVTEEQRIRALQAIGRETRSAREVWQILAVRFPEAERWLASAVSHGYVKMRRTGNVRLYTVRPAGEAWLPVAQPLDEVPQITVHLGLPSGMNAEQARALMADVIDDALTVRGWAV